VFRDVCEPELVRPVGGEVAADEVVVHGWSGLLDPPALLAEHAPPAVVPADPPRGPVGDAGSQGPGLIGQETVAELRILPVRVEQRVRAICPLEGGIGHRFAEPAVVGLARALQDPARDGTRRRPALSRAGRTFSRQMRLRQVGRSPAKDLVLLLQQLDPPTSFP
jgi:hypothetical protein